MATVLPPSGRAARVGSDWDARDARGLRRRAFWCSVVLTVAFGALLARLYTLQVVRGDQYKQQAQRNRTTRISVPAPRGLITDRNGVVLATTQARRGIAVLPTLLPSKSREPEAHAQLISTLSFLTETTPQSIEERLDEARERGARPVDPVLIVEDADLKLITRIEEHRARLGAAVAVTQTLARSYPQGRLAAHALGYTGLVTARDLERSREKTKEEASVEALALTNATQISSAEIELLHDDIIGKSGLERIYDTALRGERGERVWEIDAQNRPVREAEGKTGTPGATVQLTLDARLQRAAEAGLAKARNTGAVAVLDPRSGEVLALASTPVFDPNLFSLPREKFKKAYQNVANRSDHPFLNRAVASRFPPGSTFKPITASAVLEKNISPHNSVFCNGGFRLGRRFGCWSTHGGGVDLWDALAGSCNVYFYQNSLRLGDPESSGPTFLADIARRFGLGRPTGIDLPSENAGLIPDPAWRRRINEARPDLAKWEGGNTLNMSIGQGDVLTTPLQMAVATAALANGGTLPRPHLLRVAKDGSGRIVQESQPSGQKVEISPRTLQIVREGMRKVVTDGTGRGANLKHVAVAGKTGSAEDWNNALPHSWWICFAPYDKPTIAIAVIIENSGHGSENALPVARQILEAKFPAPKKPEDEKAAI